ncbi:cytochrome P450 [Lasiosphaeria miniovina]|uniref:Cytochrome P450 n=1 Tax=Lasiosphaeria miniovina TaxID=1954250 RepID=A0AA39ZQZ9_9PEZI|nr:cytochrome P450 [Lasiosphaeria miniovina]KAK0702076.1 cytochrome P450 [Lasiosphaeria miniovina]
MSSHLVALAALAEVVAWAAWHKSLSLDLAMPLALTLVSRFFAYFALQYGALKFYHVVVYPNYVSPLRHLPGPKDNFPFMGQGKKLLTASSPIEDYVKWGNTWPDAPFIRHLTLGNMEVLLVNTPEAHREVLQTHCYSFRKPDILYRLVGEIIGRGLLFTEGEEHKKQRRILAGLFSASSIKRMLPIFHEKARSLTKFLEQGLDENRRVTFEAVDAFSKMTIDVVGVTVLGVELGNLSASDKKMDFLKCYHRLFNQSPLGALIGFVNIYVPVRKWLPVEANLGFIRANAELRRMVSMCVRERVQEIEEKQRRQQADGKAKEGSVDGDGGRDLLTMMVEERRNFKKEDELTEEDMVNHLLTFLAAGHETTASAMTWAAYILATKPGVQDKIRAEISAVLATSANAEPDLAEIERLHYLNNFCREVLRLFSPGMAPPPFPTAPPLI